MNVQAVIFDWAGTTIDYGCFSPLAPFISAFAKYDLTVSLDEARGPMGKLKIEHLRDLLNLDTVKEQFYKNNKRVANEDDTVAIYKEFEKQVFERLADFVVLIPNVAETVNTLRQMGLKIGSTTGYTKEMMDIILPLAKEQGYAPDYCVSSTEVLRGRPYPYMIYQNVLALDITDINAVIKVGDTVSDILEGVNAKCISVGVVQGSSELGLSLTEFMKLDIEQQKIRSNIVRYKMYAAGAHYVLDSISELPDLINAINQNFSNRKF
jgi:phosphonoacetaldehyde hydrolase